MAAHLTFKEREEFKQRLKSSLKKVGLNPHSPTQVRTAFLNANHGSNITLGAVYRWLEGESLPDTQNMKIVAQVCNVCPDWLRSGLLKSDTHHLPTDRLTQDPYTSHQLD
jgi:hypothetical protein